MPEYTNAAVQTVAANQNVLFTSTPVGCNTGNVIHREGSGIATLRGVTNQCRARYRVSFVGNIAVLQVVQRVRSRFLLLSMENRFRQAQLL